MATVDTRGSLRRQVDVKRLHALDAICRLVEGNIHKRKRVTVEVADLNEVLNILAIATGMIEWHGVERVEEE